MVVSIPGLCRDCQPGSAGQGETAWPGRRCQPALPAGQRGDIISQLELFQILKTRAEMAPTMAYSGSCRLSRWLQSVSQSVSQEKVIKNYEKVMRKK